MIIVGNAIVSEEIFEVHFVCDLSACRGICCVEGSSGAPLEDDERERLREVFPVVKPYLRPEGIEAIERKGLFHQDEDGDLVTPLIGDHGECAYVLFDSDGTAKCGIERAYLNGKTSWRKPISCHLYPIRLTKLGEYIGVNYHRWAICDPACVCGSRLKVPVYRFLREPLIRVFGENWYTDLEEVARIYAAGEPPIEID